MVKDVDLVYTWVDGYASDMLNKRNEYAKKTGNTDQIKQVCRYKDNQELKYSLRSVEKNIPWVRKIFIITDNQVPSWLDVKNSKIRIVDHTEIFPQDALPCFNSSAIEHCICNIDELSEHFIYSNDDTFVGKPLEKDFFFNEKGYPICRYEKPYDRNSPNLDYFTRQMINDSELIEAKFGILYSCWPHHNMDSYVKSDVIACHDLFRKEIDATIYHPFRRNDDIQRDIYSLYSCAIGHGDYKILGSLDSHMSVGEKIFVSFKKNLDYDSWLFSTNEYKQVMKIMNRFNPKLFCINDTESVENNDRDNLKDLLEKLFPEKSSFEI